MLTSLSSSATRGIWRCHVSNFKPRHFFTPAAVSRSFVSSSSSLSLTSYISEPLTLIPVKFPVQPSACGHSIPPNQRLNVFSLSLHLFGGGFRSMAIGANTVTNSTTKTETDNGTETKNGVESFAKKAKMSPLKIGTHNGTFHCDEALGCFLLRKTEKFKDAEIVRTRDEKVLSTLDAVLDVGGIYDPESNRFDHHQRGFDRVFGYGFKTKLSSAGLIYKHFGKEIVAKEMDLPEDHPDVEKIFLTLYKTFMEAVDGIDNGINQFETDAPQNYESHTNLSSRVGYLNPDWTEPGTTEKENDQFFKAMELAGGEFLDRLRYAIKSWLPARTIVAESLADRKNIHESGEIFVLKSYCPWKSHLAELEEELKLDPLPKYIIYEDDRSKSWRIQAISVAPGKFESRKALPTPWRGLRDEELSSVSGIEGGVFVHMSGFIGGNKTFEGTVEMAKKALTMD